MTLAPDTSAAQGMTSLAGTHQKTAGTPPVTGLAVRPDSGPGALARVRLFASLLRNFWYDAARFWKHSWLRGAQGREHLRSQMHLHGHFLEYGMSMSEPRKGFGLDRVHMLIDTVERYVTAWGCDSTAEIAIRTLDAYVAFNEGVDVDWLKARLSHLSGLRDTGLRAGAEVVTRAAIQEKSMIDFMGFAEARHSIRAYAPGPVDQEKIDRAVRIAQQTPSACNRQTCRVWIWTDPEMVRKVLALQSGNRNFGHQIAGVAIVASDLTHWYEVEERYQGWVDAGMFAMSLAYGLHAEGLGAVMLNWGVEQDRDKNLIAVTGIPDSSLVATMIGFGNLPESLSVPVSQREPLDLCLTMNMPLRG